ncbi:hypothetical protein M0R45_013570 [Rubus argutus]|uniref:DNA helicase n=1 Tax=Rubus argutus TaxID=59490 RepID=A0AAW1XJU0_RUBAR
MDISEEVRAAHRRELTTFLEDGTYMEDIKAVINRKDRRLIVNISDLHSYGDIGNRILRNPSDYMQAFNDAATEVASKIDPKYLKPGDQLLVGFNGPFVSRGVTPRDLLSSTLDPWFPSEALSPNVLLSGQKLLKVFISALQLETLPLVNTETLHLTWVCLQEQFIPPGMTMAIYYAENSAPGQLPRTVDVIVEDDLVDKCKPGDRVAVVGIYKALPGKSKGSVNGVFRTVLIANNVSQLNKEAQSPQYSAEDLTNIKKIAERDDAFDLLGNSLAPSIYGHSG